MKDMLRIWQQQIEEISGSWELPLTKKNQQDLLHFLDILVTYNRKHNLTRINPDDYIKKHVFDSLGLLDFVSNERFLDVGSGAGFPGIPLAIIGKGTDAVLLDSSVKRCCFLRQVISELNLKNCQVVESQIEKYFPEHLFKVVVTRAFASLEKTVRLTKHVIADGGNLWCMKAQLKQDEVANLNCEYDIISQRSYDSDTTRVLVRLYV